MKKLKHSGLNNQKGAASLLTAVVLLVCITLVALLTSKTVLVENQMAADNYRTTQAVAAANYGMDFGVNYADNGGFDQNADNIMDAFTRSTTPPIPDLISADGAVTTSAQVTFNNTACLPVGTTTFDNKTGMVVARGFSDDNLATRQITQCMGPLTVLRNGGPKQPLVSQSNVALTGNSRIANRYTNTTIWSGGKVSLHDSSMATYIKDSSVGTLSFNDLINVPSTGAGAPANTQLVSNANLGNGLDIIDDDPSLGGLVGLAFFKNFFAVDSRAQYQSMATTYSSLSAATNSGGTITSGPIWVDGDQSMNGGQIGDSTHPAIVVVNGDLSFAGGTTTIYGILYVTGKLSATGSGNIIGSSIVEGTVLPGETPATPPIVEGHGAITLVYWPAFGSTTSNPSPGLSAVISGSWRDW